MAAELGRFKGEGYDALMLDLSLTRAGEWGAGMREVTLPT
jgi:hypothetical protein